MEICTGSDFMDPDILFYYMVSKNPVTQFGIDMHREKAKAFFEEGMSQVRRNKDEALLAYLLGFGAIICLILMPSLCEPDGRRGSDSPHCFGKRI